MRFTAKLVNELTADVARFTGGRFAMVPALPRGGDTTRYVDKANDLLVWYGAEGAREACAYYIGTALGWATAAKEEMPEDIVRHVASIKAQLPARLAEWEQRGRDRAGSWALEEGLVAGSVEFPGGRA